MGNFIINNIARPLSGKKSDISEENSGVLAPATLDSWYYHDAIVQDTLKTKNEMETLMYALPKVAKYYDVDKIELLNNWTKLYGMYRCFGSDILSLYK